MRRGRQRFKHHNNHQEHTFKQEGNIVRIEQPGYTVKKDVVIVPRNKHQDEYLDYLEDENNSIVFAVGPAGTGKTMIACQYAVKLFKARQIDKIIITRPAVSVDENHGYLPGSLVEKMQPWTRPIFDIFEQYWGKKQIEWMVEEGVIEICPLAFMRGRNFNRALIIGDELQNATPNQLKMLLTRIAEGSRMILTGDLAQHDRGYEENGLKDFLVRLESCPSKMIRVCRFDYIDVVRHPAVKEVLKVYGED